MHIVIIESNAEFRQQLALRLMDEGHAITAYPDDTTGSFFLLTTSAEIGLIIMGWQGDNSEIRTPAAAKKCHPTAPLIIMTKSPSDKTFETEGHPPDLIVERTVLLRDLVPLIEGITRSAHTQNGQLLMFTS
jgi:DNA-binding response OmpR family regulator